MDHIIFHDCIIFMVQYIIPTTVVVMAEDTMVEAMVEGTVAMAV